MSRIVLAALRKHKSPTRFTQRFLLPVFRRGQVPQLPPLREGLGQKPANPRTASPIIFVNVRNPKEEIYFSVERFEAPTRHAKPNLVIYNRQEKGSKVQERDWEEGKQFAHTRQRGVFEELVIDEEHLPKEWEKVGMPRASGRMRYPIPEKEFKELQRYGVAGQSINSIGNLIVLAAGRINADQARRLSPFLIRPGTNFYEQFARSIPISRKGLQTVLSSTDTRETARVIQHEMGVSPRYAMRLATTIEDRKSKPNNREAVQKLIAFFGKA